MVNGNHIIGKTPPYEDHKSLKLHLRKNHTDYIPSTMITSRFMFNQAGTGSEVEISEKSGETIAFIGKAAEVWVAQISAWAEAVVVTCTYTNTSGVSATRTITLTDANETAFTVAIADGYMCTACSIDVANPGGVTVKVGVTGMATPVATIQATALVALEIDLSGTGKITMAQKTDQVATDGGKLGQLIYTDPWGNIKYGLGTMDAADTSAEEVFYESSSVFVTTTVIVKDYYRTREFDYEIAATDEVLIVAPGGATVYAVIAATAFKSLHSRYMVPINKTAWLAVLNAAQAIATNLDVYMTITYTPFGEDHTHTFTVPIPNNYDLALEPIIQLQAATDIQFVFKGNLSDCSFDIKILEIELEA